MKRTKRRHKTGFGYIGFGNQQTMFNRKATPPFSKLKSQLHSESRKAYNQYFNASKLSEIQKQQIKQRVKSSNRIKSVIVLVVSVILLIFIILFVKYAIEGVMFRS